MQGSLSMANFNNLCAIVDVDDLADNKLRRFIAAFLTTCDVFKLVFTFYVISQPAQYDFF